VIVVIDCGRRTVHISRPPDRWKLAALPNRLEQEEDP
jgi:hypothetical protein